MLHEAITSQLASKKYKNNFLWRLDKVIMEYNNLANQGNGTLFYNGNWNLFDQIVITPNLLNKDAKNKDFSTLKYFAHQVFRRDYLIQQEGQYKGAPLRTQAGGRWLNGFSDHLPVVMYLVKEVK